MNKKKKIPWVDESNMTPAQVEESRWQRFQQEKAKKRMKHDRGLPANCQGCSVGMRWTPVEVYNLVSFVISETKGKRNTKLMMVDLCMKFNRTSSGILSKLQEVGIIRFIEFTYKPCPGIGIRKLINLSMKMDDVVTLLIKNGWKRTRGGTLLCPEWWLHVKISSRGMNDGKDICWDW